MRFSTTVAALLYSPVAALAATPVKQSLSAHDFLTRVTPKLLSYVEGQDDVSKKTMTLKSPAELTQIFDDLGVPLEMGSDPVDSMLLLDACGGMTVSRRPRLGESMTTSRRHGDRGAPARSEFTRNRI